MRTTEIDGRIHSLVTTIQLTDERELQELQEWGIRKKTNIPGSPQFVEEETDRLVFRSAKIVAVNISVPVESTPQFIVVSRNRHPWSVEPLQRFLDHQMGETTEVVQRASLSVPFPPQ